MEDRKVLKEFPKYLLNKNSFSACFVLYDDIIYKNFRFQQINMYFFILNFNNILNEINVEANRKE